MKNKVINIHMNKKQVSKIFIKTIWTKVGRIIKLKKKRATNEFTHISSTFLFYCGMQPPLTARTQNVEQSFEVFELLIISPSLRAMSFDTEAEELIWVDLWFFKCNLYPHLLLASWDAYLYAYFRELDCTLHFTTNKINFWDRAIYPPDVVHTPLA